MSGWEDIDLGLISKNFTRERMQSHDFFDLISEHLNADRELFIHRNYLNRVTSDTECAAFEGHIVSLVLHIDKFAQQLIAFDFIAHF